MSSSSNRLFLLFLLLIILLPVLLLLKRAREYVARTINPIARGPGGAWAPNVIRAPMASQEELPATAMSETTISRRDENDRWKALIRESEAAIDDYLVPKIDMDFAAFTRCITFRVFVVVFLGVNPNTLAFPNLLQVTAALTDFYDDGQAKSTLPFEAKSALNEWLPPEQFPDSLDRILPAYEALWRIVATVVATCEDDETKSLRWLMLDFRDNPRDRQYRASFGDERSVSDIINDVVGRITPVARPPPGASTSTWPLSCMQYAFPKSSTAGYWQAPTAQEALKFAALLAAMIIGRIGLHYGISGDGLGSQGSPWGQRKIFGVNRSPSQSTINPEARPHTSTSRQNY